MSLLAKRHWSLFDRASSSTRRVLSTQTALSLGHVLLGNVVFEAKLRATKAMVESCYEGNQQMLWT